MSRMTIARELGLPEGTLRSWEGDVIPFYTTEGEDGYRDRARGVQAMRGAGLSVAEIRRALGGPVAAFDAKGEVMASSSELTYSPWRRIFIAGVTDEKSRCAALLPHFLRGMRHPVVIPAGSPSDFELPPEAKDTDWWGGRSRGQWFPDECRRYGLLHMQIDAPVGPRTGAPRPATQGVEPAAGGALRELDGLVALEKSRDAKLTNVEAQRRVFDARPDLYATYRRETTRTKGGSR